MSEMAIYQQPSDLADKTDVRKILLQRPRHGCKLLRVNGPVVFLANPRFAGFGICAGVCGGSSLSGTG
jgi:hypothetical protein